MRYSLKTIVLLVAALSPVVVNAAPAKADFQGDGKIFCQSAVLHTTDHNL